MQTDTFLIKTAGLRDLGGHRVWSLMVSLFGDLAQAHGQAIDGPLLSAIMQRLDIKPEATRVALHRLRKDGWLTSEKSGRISRHSLTATGRAESVAASPRIYADPHARTQDWQLVVLETPEHPAAATLTAQHFAMIAPRIFVGPAGAVPPAGALALPGQHVPEWLRAQAEPAELTASYDALLETLSILQTSLSDSTALSDLDVVVLRCLIVHNWRRLVLRHPMLPIALTRPDWSGHLCHFAVWDLLQRYPRPTLTDLAERRPAA